MRPDLRFDKELEGYLLSPMPPHGLMLESCFPDAIDKEKGLAINWSTMSEF